MIILYPSLDANGPFYLQKGCLLSSYSRKLRASQWSFCLCEGTDTGRAYSVTRNQAGLTEAWHCSLGAGPLPAVTVQDTLAALAVVLGLHALEASASL